MSLLDSLISHWKLDEASGNALDAHGSNELTETSGTIASATGKLGNARDLEAGDTEYFARPDNADLSTGDIDFTFALWVNAESLTGQHAIICKDDDSGQREYLLDYSSSRFRWVVWQISGAATLVNADNLGAPSTGTWYFIVVWHDAANNVIGIQVNNGTANTTSHTTGVKDGTAQFQLGARNTAIHWDGLIDSVSFWKRVLTTEEKTQLYNDGNGLDYDDWADDNSSSSTSSISSSSTSSQSSSSSSTLSSQSSSSSSTLSSSSTSSSISSSSSSSVSSSSSSTLSSSSSSSISSSSSSSSAVGTIAITTPVIRQAYQRNGSNQANIPVSGTATSLDGEELEGSFNGGAYASLGTVSSGSWSGTLANQAAGQGTLTVRSVDAPAIAATVTLISITDVFLIVGQSNAFGALDNFQTYSGDYTPVVWDGNSWEAANDPIRSNPDGSCWPLVATLFMADVDLPPAFIMYAVGGSSIAQWANGTENHDGATTNYTDSGAGGLKAILWYQGETDAANATSQATYQNALSAILDAWQTDMSLPTVKMVAAMIANFDAEPDADVDAIRAAIINRWNNDADILAGPVGHDQTFDLHWFSDAEGQTLANRWWRVLKNHFYSGTEDARGPRLLAASYLDDEILVEFTGGQGNLQNHTDETGWEVSDANGSRTITATGSGTTVTLTCDQALVGPVSVTFCSGDNGEGTTLKDSGTYPLPPEPILAAAASADNESSSSSLSSSSTSSVSSSSTSSLSSLSSSSSSSLSSQSSSSTLSSSSSSSISSLSSSSSSTLSSSSSSSTLSSSSSSSLSSLSSSSSSLSSSTSSTSSASSSSSSSVSSSSSSSLSSSSSSSSSSGVVVWPVSATAVRIGLGGATAVKG